jgi:hypothetical protein
MVKIKIKTPIYSYKEDNIIVIINEYIILT